MEYGVFTSSSLEIAQTKYWALCFYCNEDKSIIGSKLYNGIDDNKVLIAVCERDMHKKRTRYAFKTINDMKYTNDFEGVCRLLGTSFEYNVSELDKIEELELSEPYMMPTVSEQGILTCLKQWRMGTFYFPMNTGMHFSMVTNKIEYVFSMQYNDCDIYCGASVNIPYNDGLFGSGQYFRIRNYADNSTPNCIFGCDLGKPINLREVKEIVCESGKCTSTSEGLYWPVKRYDDETIVLAGCGGDEYIYSRNANKSEYFK